MKKVQIEFNSTSYDIEVEQINKSDNETKYIVYCDNEHLNKHFKFPFEFTDFENNKPSTIGLHRLSSDTDSMLKTIIESVTGKEIALNQKV